MYGTDWEYAASRLLESVVRLDSEPIMIERIEPNCSVFYTSLSNNEVGMTQLDKLDVRPVSLGYVNYKGYASYVVRVPKRRDWRQGMRYNNIKSLSGPAAQEIPMRFIAKTIVNSFPAYKKCCENFTGVRDSIAWHRHWAIKKNGDLLYKGEGVVGKIVEGQPLLDEKHLYLQEYLRECL